jgi:uncharacterized integral membrane protein
VTEPTSPQPAAPPERRHRRTFQPGLWTRLVPLGLLTAYVVVFVALNTRKSKVDFVFTSTQISTIFLILLPLAIGVIAGVLTSQLYRHSGKRRR